MTQRPQSRACPAGTLSREQQAVVDHETGPMLVFAGPGSGKTRTITERIAALIRRGVPAHEILALTFTVRATEEMRVRLVRMLGQDVCQGVTVSTFHGLCNKMLRRHAQRFGRSDKYSIYDETDLRKVLVELVKAHRGEDGDEHDSLAADIAKTAVKQIAMAKCTLVTPAADARARRASRARADRGHVGAAGGRDALKRRV